MLSNCSMNPETALMEHFCCNHATLHGRCVWPKKRKTSPEMLSGHSLLVEAWSPVGYYQLSEWCLPKCCHILLYSILSDTICTGCNLQLICFRTSVLILQHFPLGVAMECIGTCQLAMHSLAWLDCMSVTTSRLNKCHCKTVTSTTFLGCLI